MDQLDKMMAWEQGDLDPDETVELFQELVDDGSVWRLQGMYGRMAHELITAGRVHA